MGRTENWTAESENTMGGRVNWTGRNSMGGRANWTGQNSMGGRVNWTGQNSMGGESELDRTEHVRVLVPCTSGCSSMPTILYTLLLVTRLVLVLENASLIRRPVAVWWCLETSVITSCTTENSTDSSGFSWN